MTTVQTPPQAAATTRIDLENYHLWQPFTQMQTFVRGEGIIIETGNGPYLVDTHGKQYLNMTSSVWNVPYGLGRDDIADAIHEQLLHLGYGSLLRAAHPKAIELAALVAEITPETLNRVFFTSNGSESIETTIKMARAYFHAKGSKKHKIISLQGAYHGCSMAALAASGFDEDKAPFLPLPAGFVQIPAPDYYRSGFEGTPEEFGLQSAQALEAAILEQNPDEVAAFLLEPVQGLGGVIIPPPGYMETVRAICDKYGVLLIVDEVTTGFGRTGKMFAIQHWDVQPDLMAMGKAMSSGYWPLGAAVATDEIWSVFLDESDSARFQHGSTYSGHPGGCAAGLATIRTMLKDDIASVSAQKGQYVLERLKDLETSPIVGDVRGLGMILAVEFVKDKQTREPLDGDTMRKIVQGCFASGVWVHLGGNKLILLPPFIIEEPQIDDAVARIGKVVRRAERWI